MGTGGLGVAYVHYGLQSGVTSAVARALLDRGHDVRLVSATGALEPRWIEVVGDFAVRGGIHTVVAARHGERPAGV